MKKILVLLMIMIFGFGITQKSLFEVSYATDNNITKNTKNAGIIKLKFEKLYVLSRLADEGILSPELYEYFKYGYKDIYSIYLSYDYLNKTNYYNKLIEIKKEALKLIKQKKQEELLQLIADNSYSLSGKLNKNFSWFPKEFEDDKNFVYMINRVKNDKYSIEVAKKMGEKLGIDYRLIMSAILTEQVRYAMTERGEMKKFIEKVPILLYLTKFSYGIGGIKSFTAEKIRDDAISYGYGKEDLEKHLNVKGENSWKKILIDKYYQVAYPAYLIKNIITRWNNEGYDISNNPGVIITLYNFGNPSNKKPHNSPKIGGADIFIKSKKYNFGGLGEAFYWWMKIYKII